MKPTLALESGSGRCDGAAHRGEAGLRSVALPLGGAAAVAVGALVAAGASLPPAVAFALLVVAVAACVNRVALFSSELSTTGEAAVLFAAVVVFRRDAPLLGPVLVALFVGPTDLLHWRNRSAVRMAYNGGTQVLAVLAGAAVYGAVATADAPIGRVAAAALVASVPYVLVDSAAAVALLHRRDGEAVGAAARHLLAVNWLSVPLALCGGCAGYLADRVGWSVAALVLLAAVFAPELVQVGWRRWSRAPAALATTVIVAVVTASACGLVAAVGPALPDALPELLVLGVAGAVLELAFVTRRGATCLRTLAPVVVSAAIVLHGDGAVAGAAALAATGVGVAAWRARRSWPRTAFDAIATGAAAAVAAALYGAVGPSRPAFSLAVLGAAVLAVVGFELVSGLASWSVVRLSRPEAGASFWRLWAWSRGRFAATTVVAIALAIVWAHVGAIGALPWAAGVVGVVVVFAPARWSRMPDGGDVEVALAAVAAELARRIDGSSLEPRSIEAVLAVSERLLEH